MSLLKDLDVSFRFEFFSFKSKEIETFVVLTLLFGF